jgi:HAD superfamily hydrolase (TIGR01509 family)
VPLPRAALLDLDGTLVDSNYQHALAWYRAFRGAGIVLPVWKLHRAVGMGGDQLVKAMTSEELDAQLGEELRIAEKALFRQTIWECEPLPGARELLAELRRRGHKVVLASSANEQDLGHFLDKLDARDVADGWTTADDVARSKPEPDVVHAAIEKAGVAAKDAVMIGDSRWDVEAARAAKVPTIAVLTGGWAREELLDAGAAMVFESLEELRERLDETPLG